ncbi:MAG: hypothetical protein EA427_08695 [Spirochaetaceae bacterium]|nr:MAG: hypothetical protein EA427_08695 [Spirochaetaceae bacterium]
MNNHNERCRVIERHGVVAAVHGAVADIEIIQRSACSSCRIRALCVPGDSASRIVQAPNQGELVPGMPVVLSMDERIGWLSVLAGFVLPLVLVVTVLFAVRSIVAREEIAGVIALGTLVPYYGGLHLFRRFFEGIVRFRVRPDGSDRPDGTERRFHIVRKEGTF